MLISKATVSRYGVNIRLINDRKMGNVVDSPFELNSFLYPIKRKPWKSDNPCGEIKLGKPEWCRLGVSFIFSPFQLTSYDGMYVIVEKPC